MADLVMGAMGSIIPKLHELLKEEYSLQAGVKKRISNLTKELDVAQAVLRKVAEVPWDQLDEQVQLWAREVRESSYDMEDVVDTFLVRVQGPDSAPEQEESLLKPLIKNMANFFKKIKARREISGDIKDIMSHLQEVAERCRRYKVNDIVTRPTKVSIVDPRLHAMYNKVRNLVGIDKPSSELKSKLQLDDMSSLKMKTVSIVGIGGLGKTTLAKAVYDNLSGDFNYRAFVSVGRNPDLQKVLQMMLIALDKKKYEKFNFPVLQDITQFIDELREFLHDNKRYFILIDDLWEKKSWETLKLAIDVDKYCEGRIIITTRKWEVAKNADEVYELPPLPPDSSRKLFYTRIYGHESKYVEYQPDEVSDQILKKCAGIPLAIITMASLLVDKPRDKWLELYESIGFGCRDNEDAESTMKKILSFSYYDLPSHLRTCFLYLSAFPEDTVIDKVSLVWMWVAEGFVPKQDGKGLFETGERYFNDLINRCLIQHVEEDGVRDYIHGCRVHDMVLDFIRSMSCEENFFTVSDNHGQGTLVQSNVVRRLVHHNKIMLYSNKPNMFDMSKVRSFIALECVDTWAPISSFKLLRVLYIECYGQLYHRQIRFEHLGHLLHLRFLCIKGAQMEKIPEEIGALKMLQTLDLFDSIILELPSSSSLPTQMVCLRLNLLDASARDSEMFSVGRLTSLEELSIYFDGQTKASRRLVKELGNLRKLRVFDTWICLEDEEMTRDLAASVRHLHKLQHLKIYTGGPEFFDSRQEMEFVLPGDLRYIVLFPIVLRKLPSCVDPLCHRKLSHLELCLMYMDKKDLITLGMLPELRYLELDLQCASLTIHNISDSNACYFPKLRCFILSKSLVMFVASKGDDGIKTVSLHIWDGKVDDSITMAQSFSDEFSSPSEELQLLSVSEDVPPVSDEENKEGSIFTRQGEGEDAATPRCMPSLQVLSFQVRLNEQTVRDVCCHRLGLEFLSSLREIRVDIVPYVRKSSVQAKAEVMAALRSAAQVHPNHPNTGNPRILATTAASPLHHLAQGGPSGSCDSGTATTRGQHTPPFHITLSDSSGAAPDPRRLSSPRLRCLAASRPCSPQCDSAAPSALLPTRLLPKR